MANSQLDRQAERLGEVFGDLIRAYQFRDRNEICCQGISVSQCYALEALSRHGPMTMGQLAGLLYLDVSTVTRIVDQLLEDGRVERVADPTDRRVTRARLTAGGAEAIGRIRSLLAERYRSVLETIPPESRQAVVEAMEKIYEASVARGCCAEGPSERSAIHE